MTKRERSSRPDRPSPERSLDALLDSDPLDWDSRDGGSLPDDDPARWQAVAQVLAALTSPPESSELTGEARALAEFRALAAARSRGADLPPQTSRRDPGWMTWLPGGRPAVAAATGAVLMGGLLALAYSGDLPGPAQRLAHTTINAPAARPDPHPVASSQPTWLPGPPGSAGPGATDASDRLDHRAHGGSASGRRHRSGPSSSPPGHRSDRPGSGRRGQSGRPGRSSEPQPTREPSSSASISPSAGATPSPSATPSPGITPSRARPARRALLPDHPPPPVAAAGAVRRAGSQPPRGPGPSHIPW